MQKILIIQTAFIGDVVLATAMLEKLHKQLPAASLDMLVRKGNESLFNGHPFMNRVLVWDKQKRKYSNLWNTIREIRKNRYDMVINVQRFAATGLMTILSGSPVTIGFDKNPFSLFFSKKIGHQVNEEGRPMHEIDRNQLLLNTIAAGAAAMPRLYPSVNDFEKLSALKNQPYICIAPASVWFTKQFPARQWELFINQIPPGMKIYLLGGRGDIALCESIKAHAGNISVENLAGKLSFLESAALQKDALMNYVNDSAPMHFASAVNAPTAALYCSTVPAFGFGPLADQRHIIETKEPLSCRPCGLHGKKDCPLQHFNCAHTIQTEQLLGVLPA